MIFDARKLPHKTLLEADICIIGSGPAGISLARELNDQHFRCILLEGGGMTMDRASLSIYKGESAGLPYDDLDQVRSRFFGGSSNCWGGFCRPLDPHDFTFRDWIPNSGWPFSRSVLLPYYRRAQSIFGLGPLNYSPQHWEYSIGRPNARLIPFERGRVINFISHLSPPTRFGKVYRGEIEKAPYLTTYIYANATEIETTPEGRRVTGIRVRTFTQSEFRVTAHVYVLATGGIENARLLLASNQQQSAGVGNQHDLVGRYFMEHPRIRSGQILFHDPRMYSGMYDMHVVYPGGMSASGTKIAAHFGLAPETQRTERLTNTRSYVWSRFVGDDATGRDALAAIYQALRRGRSLSGKYRSTTTDVLRDLPRLTALACGILIKPRFLARGFTLETIVEPTPIYDSRVMLGTERDVLGLPRVKLDWKLGEIEKRTMRQTQTILGKEMERIGVGTVVVDAPVEGEPWPEKLRWCWHHMGTTRMHVDPHKGVVDPNCRVHGMENLFIAGSSVFTTAGSDMPTLTIVALALRLADHITALLRAGRAAVRSRRP